MKGDVMPIRPSRRLLSALVICVAMATSAIAQPPAAAPSTPNTAPAAGKGLPMWVIRDADSTIYMTGTVHLLPDGADWHSPRLDAALNEASELWLELAEIADPEGLDAKVEPVLEKYAAWDGPPLSTFLTAEENAMLAAALKRANASPEVIAKTEKLQPWYATYALGRNQYMGANYKKENGIDRALAKIAVTRGIPVKGMEEIEDQISLGTGDAPEDQVAELRARLTIAPEMQQALERVANIAYGGWARGETNAVEALITMMSLGAAATDSTIDPLLLDRNETWAGEIEEMLEGSGVIFIAVGAGHLVGPDSLQQRLKLRGIETQRY
jgi:uncharacterized protein YbaP (TraB family)